MKYQNIINIIQLSEKDYTVNNVDAIDINSVLTTPNLGLIGAHGQEPTKTLIKTHIANKNKDVNISYVSVHDITKTSAIIAGMAPIYYGSVKVTYIIGVVPITHDLTTPNLREIFTIEKPTVEKIKIALKNNSINPNLDLQAITIKDITVNSAKIVGDGNRYSGEISVSFTIKQIEELNNWTYGAVSAVCANAKGIFVGTSDGIYDDSVYKSTDDGVTFSRLSGTTGRVVSLISDNNNNVYAATETDTSMGKVFMSTDGNHFSVVSGISPIGGSRPTYLTVDNHNNVYAAVTYTSTGYKFAKVYKKTGNGDFTLVDDTFGSNARCTSITVSSDGTIFAGTMTSTGIGALYKSILGTSRFLKVSDITEEITSLTTDSNDNVYVGTKTRDAAGSLYGGYDDNTRFSIISGTTGTVVSLISDANGNVYAGTRTGSSIGGLYKGNSGSNFSTILGTTGTVYGLGIINSSGNLYVGTSTSLTTGKIFKGNI